MIPERRRQAAGGRRQKTEARIQEGALRVPEVRWRMPSLRTAAFAPDSSLLNCSMDRATIGMGRAYIAAATIEARARNESILVVRIAAGAVPARTASSKTAVVVLEPMVFGIARMRPAAIWPESGGGGVPRVIFFPCLVTVPPQESERLGHNQYSPSGSPCHYDTAFDYISHSDS